MRIAGHTLRQPPAISCPSDWTPSLRKLSIVKLFHPHLSDTHASNTQLFHTHYTLHTIRFHTIFSHAHIPVTFLLHVSFCTYWKKLTSGAIRSLIGTNAPKKFRSGNGMTPWHRTWICQKNLIEARKTYSNESPGQSSTTQIS